MPKDDNPDFIIDFWNTDTHRKILLAGATDHDAFAIVRRNLFCQGICPHLLAYDLGFTVKLQITDADILSKCYVDQRVWSEEKLSDEEQIEFLEEMQKRYISPSMA